MATIKQSLTEKPNEATKKRIGRAFFGDSFDEKRGLKDFVDYFNYYDGEIDWFRPGVTPESDQLAGLVAKTHDDLLVIVGILRQHSKSEKIKVRSILRSHFGDCEDLALNRSMDIAIRMWLQINVREDEFRVMGKGIPHVQWDESSTLREFLASVFPIAGWELGAKERRLDPHFTAANMVEICGLTIEWTTSLADHLRLDRLKKVLWVYPYKGCLRAFLSGAKTAGGHPSPLPCTLLEETIQTLDLLFPFWDDRTKRLLKKQGQTFHGVKNFEEGRNLHLLDFEHWRDRLLDVYEEVYRSPPVSWAQLYNDRRNPQQFWTFWIALVILILTLISTAASIVSMATGIVQMLLAIEASHQK